MSKNESLWCGFEYWLPCTKECKYYETCTRDPYKKGEEKDEIPKETGRNRSC